MPGDNFVKNNFFYSFRRTIGPLFLIFASPTVAMVMLYISLHLGGSFEAFWHLCSQEGIFTTLYSIWRPYVFGTTTAWQILLIFAASQLLFMKCLPGKKFQGPATARGNVPEYKANGVLSFLTTVGLFYLCAYPFHLFSPTIIYDHFQGLIGALNLFSLGFCLMLYFKGKYAPSSTDAGTSGNPIFDYYWGTELYPKILGWHVKMFTNCRFGMMGWPLIILSFAAKQEALYGISDSMLVAVALQLIYIFKFFCWETGYLKSLDIMYDRAGFYICWGCLVWVPAIYTSPILYLVNHPNHLGVFLSSAFLLCGSLCIFINYLADRQRQRVRATGGACRVWGKHPHYTMASYLTEQGERKQSLLLLSGWWGISRHFHYIPELLASFFWTVPALFLNLQPYFYVIYLTILLFDRAIRDDKRCSEKYGEDWKLHCQKVRYKIIPFIY